MLLATSRTYRCLGFNPYRAITRVAACMADGDEGPTALQRNPTMAGAAKLGTSF